MCSTRPLSRRSPLWFRGPPRLPYIGRSPLSNLTRTRDLRPLNRTPAALRIHPRPNGKRNPGCAPAGASARQVVQNFVAAKVAELIVDRLEIIDVEQQDAKGRQSFMRLAFGDQIPAVSDSGEGSSEAWSSVSRSGSESRPDASIRQALELGGNSCNRAMSPDFAI